MVSVRHWWGAVGPGTAVADLFRKTAVAALPPHEWVAIGHIGLQHAPDQNAVIAGLHHLMPLTHQTGMGTLKHGYAVEPALPGQILKAVLTGEREGVGHLFLICGEDVHTESRRLRHEIVRP